MASPQCLVRFPAEVQIWYRLPLEPLGRLLAGLSPLLVVGCVRFLSNTLVTYLLSSTFTASYKRSFDQDGIRLVTPYEPIACARNFLFFSCYGPFYQDTIGDSRDKTIECPHS